MNITIDFIGWSFDFIKRHAEALIFEVQLNEGYLLVARNSDGVKPVNFLKTVLKEDFEL